MRRPGECGRSDRVAITSATHWLSIIVQEVYEIHYWQPAWTTPYVTRTFESTSVPGRFEFIGTVAGEPVRGQYLGQSVAHYFSRGAQNPITYVNSPK
jgi:hypothetical protein